MGAAIQYPHISIDGDGVARLADSRYKVLHLAGEHYHYGWSAEEILRQHPDLRPEEVYSALTFFYDHYEELAKELSTTAERTQSLRVGSSLSRDELLRRKTQTERS